MLMPFAVALGILLIPQFGQCAGDESRQLDAHLAHVFHNGEALIGDKEKSVTVKQKSPVYGK